MLAVHNWQPCNERALFQPMASDRMQMQVEKAKAKLPVEKAAAMMLTVGRTYWAPNGCSEAGRCLYPDLQLMHLREVKEGAELRASRNRHFLAEGNAGIVDGNDARVVVGSSRMKMTAKLAFGDSIGFVVIVGNIGLTADGNSCCSLYGPSRGRTSGGQLGKEPVED